MKLADFQAVLDKIAKFGHRQPMLSLFNWGEAPLHPDLAGIIRLIHERGYKCEISTNLNHFPNMEAVMEAAPDCIRISLSGSRNSSYQRTHTRGDIDRVKENMRRLRELADLNGHRSQIQVGFHVYRHNFPGEFVEMAQLAHELGFYFEPTIATLMPVELLVDIAENRVSATDHPITDSLVFPIESMTSGLERTPANQDCLFRTHMTAINADMSVSLCCATYADAYTITSSFLDLTPNTPLPDNCGALCDTCQHHKYDLLFTDQKTEAWWDRANDVLGEDWSRYMAHFRRLGGPDIWFEDDFISMQALYDRAYDLQTRLHLTEAETLYTHLLNAEPGHAASWFQMAMLRIGQENIAEARSYLEKAVALDGANPHFRLNLARILVSLKRRPEARKHFTRLFLDGHIRMFTWADRIFWVVSHLLMLIGR